MSWFISGITPLPRVLSRDDKNQAHLFPIYHWPGLGAEGEITLPSVGHPALNLPVRSAQ